jgi:uncharacterized protein (TIGR03086 family)
MGGYFLRGLDYAQRIVSGVRSDQWASSTPCSEWSMRDLVGHITAENLWAVELFAGKTVAEVGDALEGDVLGDDPIAAFNAAAVGARQASSAPGAMDMTVHVSFADLPGSAYASQLFLDMLIHGWDMAKASGQDATMDGELIAAAMPVASEIAELARQVGVYGTEFTPPAGSSDQDRLLAIVGRHGAWAPAA